MNYYIKITGSGTKDEIVDALEGLAHSIRITPDNEMNEEGADWEDNILITEINHD